MISVKIGFASKEKDKNGVQKCQAFILNQIAASQGSTDFTALWDNSPFFKINDLGRSGVISKHLQSEGVLPEVVSIILQSWKAGTRKQYSLAWGKWCVWCERVKCS
ncbi:uncharacterized protein LOC132744281 [Ruditapes philippinarum]|uniref:uncharacterized protein LOC132744281 n=1 Tax=Ruditapes philippinarum TaxID=129788 RepID=UPI00295AEBEF|nr:uncharacterized protein LOC132744281 [Ruditapes philippinarum]